MFLILLSDQISDDETYNRLLKAINAKEMVPWRVNVCACVLVRVRTCVCVCVCVYGFMPASVCMPGCLLVYACIYSIACYLHNLLRHPLLFSLMFLLYFLYILFFCFPFTRTPSLCTFTCLFDTLWSVRPNYLSGQLPDVTYTYFFYKKLW